MGLLEKAKTGSQVKSQLSEDKKKNSLLQKAENISKASQKETSVNKGLFKRAQELEEKNQSTQKGFEINEIHEPLNLEDELPQPELETSEDDFGIDEVSANFKGFSPSLDEKQSDENENLGFSLNEDDSTESDLIQSEEKEEQVTQEEKLEEKEKENLGSIPPDDLFKDWEKDAEYEAKKTPFRPISEDPIDEKKDFLFDDDSDFTTVPSETHIASKKKIENYLALFELIKEISLVESYDDFFEGLSYSLTGQIGCDSIAIFSSKHAEFETLYLVDSHGIEVNPDWKIHRDDELYSIFCNEISVRYFFDIVAKIPTREKDFLNELSSEIIMPIHCHEKLYGLIFVGKNIAGEDYTVDDLEYIKIAGELAGSFFEKIQETEKKNAQISNLNEVIKANEIIISVSRKLSEVRNIDGAMDELFDTFSKELGVMRYTIFIFDREGERGYIPFSSNVISPESIQKLHIERDSEIVGIVSNIPGVYNIENFREIRDLKRQISNDDLGFIKEFIVVPLINLNWLVGFIVVHETSFPWTNTNREIAVGISEVSAPVIANVMMLKEKESVFRDPFNPIEKRLEEEIRKSEKLSVSFCLVVLKIQDSSRIINLLGQEFFVNFADFLRNKIYENISESDFLVKIGRGKFAVILQGKDTEEANIVIKKIKLKISEYEKSPKNFTLSVNTHSIAYPK
ncbi:MAG: diguanylate cyclase, partial [Leptospiraceae bacterium]|nr:diguanylate cyclase [Leptospiraceae bacterium]